MAAPLVFEINPVPPLKASCLEKKWMVFDQENAHTSTNNKMLRFFFTIERKSVRPIELYSDFSP